MENKIDSKFVPAIVIAGKMGYGKDYVGNLIKDNFLNIEKISFADALKEEVEYIINLVKSNYSLENIAKEMNVTKDEVLPMYEAIFQFDNVNELTVKKKNSTIRFMLQYWGTDVRRKNNENYWVQKTVNKILEINKLGNVALITDGRFPNELKGVSELNGITIQLDISKEKQIENLLNRDGILPNKEAFNHPSETSYLEYKDFDLILTEDILSDNDLILSEIKKTIDNKVKI